MERAAPAASAPPNTLAAALLAAGIDFEQEGRTIDALSTYRTLVKTHPASAEAKAATALIARLTDQLDVEAQDARAARVLEIARKLEASGEKALALSHYRQIVKVYPGTPSAKTAQQRAEALDRP
jgi:TolA-binding protein